MSSISNVSDYKFKLYDQSRVIYRLVVHVKDEQYVYFKHYLYNEIPNHYVLK